LPSANPAGTRQRFLFFFKKIFCRVPTLQALGKDFFLKISLPSALWLALGKV